MNRYLLDTNIILSYLRGHSLYQQIEQELKLSDPKSIILLSVVTKAELMSLGSICPKTHTKLIISQLS